VITSIGTYLPRWGTATCRQAGEDEDALTLAVAAGLGALDGIDPAAVHTVVFVTRDFPLVEGGNAAALLGGLGLAHETQVREQLGGAPAALDAVGAALPGTLVIGADSSGAAGAAGAAAVFCGSDGLSLDPGAHATRSMPVSTRDAMGRRTDYADPRLLRVRGLGASLESVGARGAFDVAAGIGPKDAAGLAVKGAPSMPTTGSSSAIFALAALAERGSGGSVLAAEQAAVSIAALSIGSVPVHRDELAPQPLPPGTRLDGAPISISLSAYERAFDAKLRLQADKCLTCGTLAYPHRFRCISCGAEDETGLEALPRDAEVHSLSTIYTAVPGLTTPYTVVLAELGDSGVRLLVRLTGAPAGSVKIGDTGRLVFRLVAVRSGVPDYGYSFFPADAPRQEVAA
jgi:uncharacterized OB-fold protein